MPRIDAIDVANYTPVPTIAQVNLLKQMGVKRAIVGSSYGTVARRQLQVFSENGLEIQAYGWITHPFRPDLLWRVLAAIRELPVTRIWLDAEDTVPTGRTREEVVQDIRDAIAYMRQTAPDMPIGIYSAAWWWVPYTGNYKGQDICSLPLWIANYRNPDGVDYKKLLFGGWSADKVDMWQYTGSIDTAGLNTDRNLIIEEVGVPGRMYTDAQIDAKIGAVINALAGINERVVSQAEDIDALAAALFDHIRNHSMTWSEGQLATVEKLLADLEAKRLSIAEALREAAEAFNGDD